LNAKWYYQGHLRDAKVLILHDVGHGFGFSGGDGSDLLPPGQEVKDLRAGVFDRMGDPRGDMDQGAVPGNNPFLDLIEGSFPKETAGPVEKVKPLGVAGMQVVAPALARTDGNQVEGFAEVLGCLESALPGKVTHSPSVGVNLSTQIDKFHGYHLDSFGSGASIANKLLPIEFLAKLPDIM
jgi:hypothetical protein